MTHQNHHSQSSNHPQSPEEETVDVRDLVSKSGYEKDPREIIENPEVTPQMPVESSDSQVGMERSDR